MPVPRLAVHRSAASFSTGEETAAECLQAQTTLMYKPPLPGYKRDFGIGSGKESAVPSASLTIHSSTLPLYNGIGEEPAVALDMPHSSDLCVGNPTPR